MCFAAIFVPEFPVEALLRAEPGLRTQAIAVLEGKPPLQKVFAVNERARRAGVEPGMTKLQVETCTNVALRARSSAQEDAAHAALLDCARSFSPRVEDSGCDTLIIDLVGLETLFGPPAKIACDIARRAFDFGMEINVAVASNPDAAVLSARGCSGITVIPEGKEAEQLGSLPVDVLFAGLGAHASVEEPEPLLETLERWGIRNLRALAALPDVALSERLGQDGLRLQQLARGTASRTLVPVDSPLGFEEALELEHPVVLLEPLAFLLNRMLEQICARLAARALATQEVRLELQLDQRCNEEVSECGSTSTGEDSGHSRKTFQRTLRLPVPLLDAKVFLNLLQLDLNAHPPGAPIAGIRLSAEPARPRADQGGLFLPPSPEPEKLELTLSRINGIVGEGKAGSVKLLDTHRPEGFQMQRFAAGLQRLKPLSEATFTAALKRCATQKRNPNPMQKHDEVDTNSLVTALRMFRPPVRATVTVRHGKPVQVECPKRKDVRGEILWAAGPWRSSGDWWDQEPWSRDEWDIAVQGECGIALYRLVRDLLNGRWLLEGVYD